MKRKKFLVFAVAIVFLPILGSALTLTILSIGGICHFSKISPEVLAVTTTASFIILLLNHLYSVRIQRLSEAFSKEKEHYDLEELNLESANLRNDFERFKRNNLHAIKAHLKVSTLFWIQIYRRDKAKTFEEAKKEILHDLKKEFASIAWMEEILEELRIEIARYGEKKGPSPP